MRPLWSRVISSGSDPGRAAHDSDLVVQLLFFSGAETCGRSRHSSANTPALRARPISQRFAQVRAVSEAREARSVVVELDNGKRRDRDSDAVAIASDIEPQKGAEQDTDRRFVGHHEHVTGRVFALDLIEYAKARRATSMPRSPPVGAFQPASASQCR